MNFFKYKWKYSLSLLASKLYFKPSHEKEFLFITHSGTKGWILDAKAVRLSKYMPVSSKVYYSKKFRYLPDAEGYFFLHQKYFARAIRYNYRLFKRKTIVMFTHAEWDSNYTPQHMAYVLNFADKVVCLNKNIAEELATCGVKKEKLEIFHMASNPQMFTPKKDRNGSGAIGFCMGYYERKNPELMIEIVKNMPDRKFILIGRNWDKYENFKKIKSLANFKYYDDIPYEEYPALYHEMDVFVSTSHLEGGPVPLLEAMLCNVVPVVSNTGFCPDLIKHCENGFLFNSTDPVENVINLINQAYTLKNSVREAALPHSWENYGKEIFRLFQEIKSKV